MFIVTAEVQEVGKNSILIIWDWLTYNHINNVKYMGYKGAPLTNIYPL